MNESSNHKPSVVICQSMDAYVASILDGPQFNGVLGEDFIPLLAARGEEANVRFTLPAEVAYQRYRAAKSPEDVRARSMRVLLEQCRRSWDRLNVTSTRVCVVAEDDPAAPLGVVHAATAGKRLVVLRQAQDFADLATKLRDALSMTLVLSPRMCAHWGMDHIRDYFTGEGNGSQRTWGIITASTLSKLSNLIARIKLRSLSPLPTGKIFRDYTFPLSMTGEQGLSEFTLPSHPSEHIQHLTREQTGLAVFVGHGRPYCAMGGNLCSLKRGAIARTDTCVTGYQCVFSGWPRVPAQELLADVVFADSCSISSMRSCRPEGNDGSNLGVRLLDGYASAVIAPHRSNSPLLLSPYLVWSLLRLGDSVGEVCSKLNQIYSERLRSAEPFVLLGDPEMQVFGSPFSPRVRATVTKVDAETWTVQCRVTGAVTLFECMDNNLCEAAKRGVLHCLPKEGHDMKIVAEALPVGTQGRSLQLLAVCSGKPDAREIELQITSRPPFRPEVTAAGIAYLDNLRLERNWLNDFNESERKSELETELSSLLKSIERKLTVVNSYPIMTRSHYEDMFEAERKVRQICRRIGRTMIRNIVAVSKKQGLWIYNHYLNSIGLRRVSEELLAEPCPYCGNRVIVCNYQVGLWPTHARRLLECESCLFLYDVESRSGPLLLKAPQHMSKGRDYVVCLEGCNTSSMPVLVHAALTIDRMGNRSGAFIVKPETGEAEIGPGADFRFSFEVNFSKELPSHLFHAKGITVVNGAVSWALKKIVVCEDSISLKQDRALTGKQRTSSARSRL